MTQTLPVLADLGPNGGLTAYLSEVNTAPILSVEEEKALAKRFHDESDLDAARQL
ncbi:MAG: sigma-70 factor domain-containing protein, partial [Gammaproteobacteria bacterium]